MNYSFKDPRPSQITTWDRNPERPGLTLGQPAELKNIAGRLDSIWSCPFALVRPGRLHGPYMGLLFDTSGCVKGLSVWQLSHSQWILVLGSLWACTLRVHWGEGRWSTAHSSCLLVALADQGAALHLRPAMSSHGVCDLCCSELPTLLFTAWAKN